MNNLELYQALKHQMRPGDLVVFWGKGILSWLIRFFAGGGPSHVAVVRQGIHNGSDVQIVESTILNGKDGVQTNSLRDRIVGYDDGGSIAWLPLSEESHKEIDWKRFYEFIGFTQDHVNYGVFELGEFLVRMVPGLGSRLCQGEDKDRMVCSAFVTALWKYSGLLKGINFEKVTPQDLVEMSLYAKLEPLAGKPPKIRAFNTK